MIKPNYKNYQVLAIYVVLVLVLRGFSFFPSVIDHDESTYIYIAKAIRNGSLYFVDVIDTKPIGIFLLFGFFQEVFGEPVWVIRLMTALWIGFTAFFLFLVHRRLSNDYKASFATGIIYLFLTSIYPTRGISPNTELFFNLFTIISLWLILTQTKWHYFFGAGLLLGAGFMIKYVVLFDAAAFALFSAWLAWRKQFSVQQLLLRYLYLGAGFAIPFAGVLIFYTLQGHQETFMYYTFELSDNYLIKKNLMDYLIYLGGLFGQFFPVTFMFFYCLFHKKDTDSGLWMLTSAWSVLVLIVILLPGKFFGHYFFQFMLPFALLAGSFFDSRRPRGRFWNRLLSPKLGYSLLAIFIAILVCFHWNSYFRKPDVVKQVASFLEPKLERDDVIYTGNYHHILYHLLDKESPTPYVHSSLLWDPIHLDALKFDHDKEMMYILAQQPRFILMNKELKVDISVLFEALEEQYELIKDFDDGPLVYEMMNEK